MKLIRKLSVLLVLVLVISAISVPAFALGYYRGTLRVINCDSWVSLRSYPSTSASRVTTVPLGAYVEAYYYNSQFSECYYNGMRCYILNSYLGSSYDYYTPSYSSGSYLGAATVVNCKEWVSLRSAPSTSASRVTTVPLGATVEAYYYNSEYTECYYRGMHGYILSTYLTTNWNSSAASSSSNYLGKKTVAYCNEFVTLRSSPSTSASAVTRVALGQVVDAYYYNGTFTKCYYNGMSGYILSRYLR